MSELLEVLAALGTMVVFIILWRLFLIRLDKWVSSLDQ